MSLLLCFDDADEIVSIEWSSRLSALNCMRTQCTYTEALLSAGPMPNLKR